MVGLGISGSDMAGQLAQHAERVFVAVRTPQYIIPITVLGQPLDKIAGGDLPNLTALPHWLASAVLWASGGILEYVQRRMTESWLRLGLKRPDGSIFSKFPVADDKDNTFYNAVDQGKVELRNEVKSFSPNGTVHYINNDNHTGATTNTIQTDTIDCVVFCTGYSFLHPYLPPHLSPRPRRPIHIPTGRYPDVGELSYYTMTSDTTFLIVSPYCRQLYFMTEVQAGYDWMVFQDQAKSYRHHYHSTTTTAAGW